MWDWNTTGMSTMSLYVEILITSLLFIDLFLDVKSDIN